MVLGFFKKTCFFSIGGWECLLSTTWRQGRSLNGDAVVFDNIEIFVLFSFAWYVCCCWTQDDCVARELPNEVRLVKSCGVAAEG